MSLVTPKPAAEFSALAITKSTSWWRRAAQALAQQLAPRLADDVADEQDPHAAGLTLRSVTATTWARAAALRQLGQQDRQLAGIAASRVAPGTSNAPVSRTARAKRPNSRSIRWNLVSSARTRAGAFSPATIRTPVLNRIRRLGRDTRGVHDDFDCCRRSRRRRGPGGRRRRGPGDPARGRRPGRRTARGCRRRARGDSPGRMKVNWATAAPIIASQTGRSKRQAFIFLSSLCIDELNMSVLQLRKHA